jgi:hypothetical protein
MGLLSGWKQRRVEQFQGGAALYNQTRNEIWRREIARLGESEFYRRRNALIDYRRGQAGPSGFEDWEERLHTEIIARALVLAQQTTDRL